MGSLAVHMQRTHEFTLPSLWETLSTPILVWYGWPKTFSDTCRSVLKSLSLLILPVVLYQS
jgi:hypothetical protein